MADSETIKIRAAAPMVLHVPEMISKMGGGESWNHAVNARDTLVRSLSTAVTATTMTRGVPGAPPSLSFVAAAGTVSSALDEPSTEVADAAESPELQQLRHRQKTLPKSAVHLPTLLCEDLAPNDATVFASPDDPVKRYSLGGGFELAFIQSGDRRVKAVQLRPVPNGYVLEVNLAHKTVEAVTPAPASAQATVLGTTEDHVDLTIRAFVRATVRDKTYEWDFDSVEVKTDGWVLVHTVQGTDSEAADRLIALHRAMTEAPDAKLIIRRTLSLAVPAPFSVPPAAGPSSRGAAPPRRVMGAPRASLSAVLEAIPTRAATLPTAPPRLVSLFAIDSTVDFQFDKELDRNVFADLDPDVGTTRNGWNQFPVRWQPDAASPAVNHWYFQNPDARHEVYFLPDEFLVQRRSDSPHEPCLKLSVLDGGAKLSLSYIAVPSWNPARITSAVAELAAKLEVPDDLSEIYLFPAANTALYLKLPNADALGGPGFVKQTGVHIDLTTAIDGTVTLRAEDFKPVLDALIHDASDLMAGYVEVTVDAKPISIPVTVRATHASGPLCDYATTVNRAAGALTVTATNATESPIEVSETPFKVLRKNEPIPNGIPKTVDPYLPVVLLPGGTLTETFDVSPGDSGEFRLALEDSSLSVQPDAKAILDAILDPNVETSAALHVTFKVPTSAFARPSSGPQLSVLQIELQNSNVTLNFTRESATGGASADWLSQTATVPLPLSAYLLGQFTGSAAEYRYRVRRIYTDEPPRVDSAFTTSSLDTVYVSPNAAS